MSTAHASAAKATTPLAELTSCSELRFARDLGWEDLGERERALVTHGRGCEP